MVTLLLSQGVPMIAHGDEIGRTQRGNNNTYCQDNELSWMDWDSVDTDMLAFTRLLVGLRARHPIFRRRRFFQGRHIDRWDVVPDISWLQPNAELMTAQDWNVGYAKTLTVVLNGSALGERDRFGRRLTDQSFALFFNADTEPARCVVPGRSTSAVWTEVLDTAAWPPSPTEHTRIEHSRVALPGTDGLWTDHPGTGRAATDHVTSASVPRVPAGTVRVIAPRSVVVLREISRSHRAQRSEGTSSAAAPRRSGDGPTSPRPRRPATP
jgi:hypothetical protein